MRRTVLVFSQVPVLVMYWIGWLDTHASGVAGSRGEEHSGYSDPVSVYTAATENQKH